MTDSDAPRGFVRKYFDLEPELNDYLVAAAKARGQSVRVYLRALVMQDKQTQEQVSGKGKGKK